MPGCIDFLSIGVSTSGASKGLDTLIYASGFCGNHTVVIRVAKSADLICHIAVATMASIGGITVRCTTGVSYHCIIIVPGCIDFLGIGITAGVASKGFNAFFSAGRLGGDDTLVILVTQLHVHADDILQNEHHVARVDLGVGNHVGICFLLVG